MLPKYTYCPLNEWVAKKKKEKRFKEKKDLRNKLPIFPLDSNC